eukprot:tig00001299_g8063.t1
MVQYWCYTLPPPPGEAGGTGAGDGAAPPKPEIRKCVLAAPEGRATHWQWHILDAACEYIGEMCRDADKTAGIDADFRTELQQCLGLLLEFSKSEAPTPLDLMGATEGTSEAADLGGRLQGSMERVGLGAAAALAFSSCTSPPADAERLLVELRRLQVYMPERSYIESHIAPFLENAIRGKHKMEADFDLDD